ncbi:VOC family protein [Vibrio paucivorans]|uniref:VOC family protein n=1 Tax=Vibrio paucivorans TaxID=2829489 RepID=A0A9X3CCW9_9VIBR|nr:VOC family protein [Vibrio paucivorans]MCW8333428.1 VOC family protein [Vibrio paucivorans]
MEPRVSIITLGVESLEVAFKFYSTLGFESSKNPEDGIIFFKTGGVCLALYPNQALADDVSPHLSPNRSQFSGVTLAHNTRSKAEVDEILAMAERAGGTIVKPAQDVFWGGYSGYFSDPDGHLWEIAYGDCWEFNDDGSLVID